MRNAARQLARRLWAGLEAAIPWLLWPVNLVLAVALRRWVRPGSVLHVCYPVHLIHYMVQILRAHGCNAAYLAVGTALEWTQSDYRFQRWRRWMPLALTEFWFFWTVMARYQVHHLHFMQGISQSGWEWAILKRLGRKIVVYYSGCEARDSSRNRQLHPEVNICQDCDYGQTLCDGAWSRRRRRLSARYADLELVTTPDMKDFIPQALHFPFFCPPPQILPSRRRPHWPENGCLRVVHVTNHPGIEGSNAIARAVATLADRGLPVEFIHLSRTPYPQVLQELADADLSIGKMKMGYYANAQIEAMCCGTPVVTYVRPEFITADLRDSALILSSLGELEATLERLILDPEELTRRRSHCQADITRFHDNDQLAHRLIAMYRALEAGHTASAIARLVPEGLCPMKMVQPPTGQTRALDLS